MLLDIFIKAGCDQRLGAGAGASIFFSGALLPYCCLHNIQIVGDQKKNIRHKDGQQSRQKVCNLAQQLDVYRRHLRGTL